MNDITAPQCECRAGMYNPMCPNGVGDLQHEVLKLATWGNPHRRSNRGFGLPNTQIPSSPSSSVRETESVKSAEELDPWTVPTFSNGDSSEPDTTKTIAWPSADPATPSGKSTKTTTTNFSWSDGSDKKHTTSLRPKRGR